MTATPATREEVVRRVSIADAYRTFAARQYPAVKRPLPSSPYNKETGNG